MEATPAPREGLDPDRVTFALTLAVLALFPLITGPIVWHAPGAVNDLNQRVSVSPYDLPLILLVVASAADALERRAWARTPLAVLTALTLGWLLIATAAHPSWRGLDWFVHVAGAWAIVRTVSRATARRQNVLLAAVVGLGVFQAALGAAQSFNGEIVGLGPLEWKADLFVFGTSSAAARGSFTHPYHLASFLMVAIGAAVVLLQRCSPRAQTSVLAAIGAIALAIPFTYSRAMLLALLPMVVLLWTFRSASRVAAVVLVVGLIVGGVAGLDGWTDRATRTSNRDSVDSNRSIRLTEAGRLVAEEPIFGIGPARYVIALRDVEHEELLPAHNILAQAAAEAGLPGGAFVLASLGALAIWVFRRGRLVVVAALTLLPFHLLDSYPHTYATGLIVSGLWLAILRPAADVRARPADTESGADLPAHAFQGT